MIQDFLTSLGISLGICNRVELGRILGDACKCGTFRKVQVPYIFIKIFLGCSLYTVGTCAQVDGVQVILKDHIFAVFFLNLHGKILFLKFTCKTFQLCGFVSPVCKNIVLQKLLCDGTGTLRKITGCDCFHTGTCNTPDINTVMFIKTFILNSHHCMLQADRDLLQSYRETVGCRC